MMQYSSVADYAADGVRIHVGEPTSTIPDWRLNSGKALGTDNPRSVGNYSLSMITMHSSSFCTLPTSSQLGSTSPSRGVAAELANGAKHERR
jgi:hypothetical protein